MPCLARCIIQDTRRQAVLTVNVLARTNSDLIGFQRIQSEILPVLYKDIVFDPSLVEEIDYGAFKEKLDRGLPLRKAAFQCLETMLEALEYRLDLKEFLQNVQSGQCVLCCASVDEFVKLEWCWLMLDYRIPGRLLRHSAHVVPHAPLSVGHSPQPAASFYRQPDVDPNGDR